MDNKKKLKELNKKLKLKIKEIKRLNKPHTNQPKWIENSKDCIIDLKNIYKLFTNGHYVNKALDNINLSIKKGSFVVVLGHSGSGKTTLMNIMSGLTRATAGKAIINGQNLTSYKNNELRIFREKNVAFVFQQYGLLQTLNLYENVKAGGLLSNKKISKEEIMNILKDIDIDKQYKSYPKELSGGQQQRASIARALIKKPKILFCDEPTGSLDSDMTFKILEIFKKINKNENTTIIIVTHDLRIGKIADHLIQIEDGKIISSDYQKPIENFNEIFNNL
ncbi:MAG: ABC transporter ATP-binding protein [Mycoplasmoidaceae bacterium]